MNGFYPVYFGRDPVGKVQVEKQGLYYRFQCRCRHSSREVYRLIVCYPGKRISVGVLVPRGDGISLDKKLPAKSFPDTDPEFFISTTPPQVQGQFIPLRPEEPFSYLSRLKDAFLTEQGGTLGILLRSTENVDIGL